MQRGGVRTRARQSSVVVEAKNSTHQRVVDGIVHGELEQPTFQAQAKGRHIVIRKTANLLQKGGSW